MLIPPKVNNGNEPGMNFLKNDVGLGEYVLLASLDNLQVPKCAT